MFIILSNMLIQLISIFQYEIYIPWSPLQNILYIEIPVLVQSTDECIWNTCHPWHHSGNILEHWWNLPNTLFSQDYHRQKLHPFVVPLFKTRRWYTTLWHICFNFLNKYPHDKLIRYTLPFCDACQKIYNFSS